MRLSIHFILTALVIVSCAKQPTMETVKRAIQQDNIVKFEKLRQQLNIDTLQFDDGGTVLHYAILAGANNIGKKLINENYQLNHTDSLNYTPLLLAIQDSNLEITEQLLEKSVNVDIKEELNGMSALHYAVYHGDTDLIKKLLLKNANINIKSSSLMRSTPLHLAIEKKQVDIVLLLLENNALDTIQDVNDDTAVDLALRSSNPDIKMLFYPKMNKTEKEDLFSYSARNTKDTTLLKKILGDSKISKTLINEAFVFAKDTSVSKLLLSKGAKIAYKHKDYDFAAIHYAAIRGDTIMLDFLINKGANVNQLSKNKRISPLMHASRLYEDYTMKSKELGLEIKFNTLLTDHIGSSDEKTPENSLAAVKFLINKNANIHFKNDSDENALYYAETSLNNDVTEYLKEMDIKTTKPFSESERKKKQRERALRNL